MNNIIEISHLNKSFGEVKAVQDLSFKVKEGELFAFLGVNGAGKSTTINIMCGQLAKDSGLNISQLPLVGCAPEWMSEKAVSIGNYVVATGIDTFLGVEPQVTGSDQMVWWLTEGIRDWVEAAYTVETDIEKLGDAMIQRIEEKRKALGI